MAMFAIPIASASAPADGATTLRCAYNLSRSFAEELHREPRLFFRPTELPSIDSRLPLTQAQRLTAFGDITRGARLARRAARRLVVWVRIARRRGANRRSTAVGPRFRRPRDGGRLQACGARPSRISNLDRCAAACAARWKHAAPNRPFTGVHRRRADRRHRRRICAAARRTLRPSREGVRFRLAPGKLPAFWRVPKLRVVHARTGAFDVAPLQYIDGAQLQALTPRPRHRAPGSRPLPAAARPSAARHRRLLRRGGHGRRRTTASGAASSVPVRSALRGEGVRPQLRAALAPRLLRSGGAPSFRLEMAKFDNLRLRAPAGPPRVRRRRRVRAFEIVGRIEREVDVRAARGQTCCDRCSHRPRCRPGLRFGYG